MPAIIPETTREKSENMKNKEFQKGFWQNHLRQDYFQKNSTIQPSTISIVHAIIVTPVGAGA